MDYTFIPKVTYILPDNPSDDVWKLFDVVVVSNIWETVWQLCCDERATLAALVLKRYDSWIMVPETWDFIEVVNEERTRMVYSSFYTILKDTFILSHSAREMLQLMCSDITKTNAYDLIQLVKDMGYVSTSACRALKNDNRHNEVAFLCSCMSKSQKRIKLY